MEKSPVITNFIDIIQKYFFSLNKKCYYGIFKLENQFDM